LKQISRPKSSRCSSIFRLHLIVNFIECIELILILILLIVLNLFKLSLVIIICLCVFA
jgi:hypothetical protein